MVAVITAAAHHDAAHKEQLMNNIDRLISQQRLKEIARGIAPLIGEKELVALTAIHWYQEHQSAVEVFQETGRSLLLAQEQNTALIAQLEVAQKERGDLLNQEFQQRLANAEHQLYMKDLTIHNIKASRMAQFRKRLAAEAALSAANEKHGWIKCSDQMPDPNRQRRVCVFTPHHAADLRYRLVPANLFKAVCSSASHWHYVNDPVEGE